MAYFEKRVTKKGIVRWRAQIRRLGLPDLNRTFRTKAHAEQWARALEGGFEAPIVGKHTLLAAMRRYSQEVSPTKRGKRWEQLRLKALEADPVARAAMAAVDSRSLGAVARSSPQGGGAGHRASGNEPAAGTLRDRQTRVEVGETQSLPRREEAA